MYFVRTKGMATLILLLLTLPVAAFDSTNDAERGSASTQPNAVPDRVVDGWVTITGVYLQRASDDEDASNRVWLLQNASEVRGLMGLAGDVAEMVRNAAVPEGTYSQLRVVISGGCVATNGGDVFATRGYGECGPADGALQMPGYSRTGLKILMNEFEVTGSSQVMMLSFDVTQAFGAARGKKGWRMLPVIHGAGITLTAGIDVTLSPGSVDVPASVDMGDFSATLLPTTGDSARVDFTDGNGDGVYEVVFDFLQADDGPFDVRLNGPDDVTFEVRPATPATLSPASGEMATVDWVFQSLTVDDGGVDCPWWVCGF